MHEIQSFSSQEDRETETESPRTEINDTEVPLFRGSNVQIGKGAIVCSDVILVGNVVIGGMGYALSVVASASDTVLIL